MRAAVTVVGGLAVLVLSFWLTLKVIDNWPQPEASDFDVAMQADGFTMSDAIVGAVDVIERDPSGRLQLQGWAFDKELTEPVSVLVLIGPKFQQIAVTDGPRPDVATSFRLSPERAKSIAFAGLTSQPVDCGPHTIVAVNQSKHLSVLASDRMVPRCSS